VFDQLLAPFAGGYFLGDYEGLAASGDRFRALFVTTTTQAGNPTDVFYGQFRSFDRAQDRAEATLSPQATAAPPVPARPNGPVRRRR
jgi:hypothetical protein